MYKLISFSFLLTLDRSSPNLFISIPEIKKVLFHPNLAFQYFDRRFSLLVKLRKLSILIIAKTIDSLYLK